MVHALGQDVLIEEVLHEHRHAHLLVSKDEFGPVLGA